MSRKYALLAVLLAWSIQAQAATFPVVRSFTGGTTAYTNETAGRQTIVRVVVATTTSVNNSITMSYTYGGSTYLGYSNSSTAFKTALWPTGTNDVAARLFTGDRILIAQTYTGRTFVTYDVLNDESGGSGSGFPLTTNASAGGFGVNGFSYLGTANITTENIRVSQGITVESLKLGSESPIISFAELSDALGLRGYVAAATYPSSFSGTPYAQGAVISLTEGASGLGGTTVTLGGNLITGVNGITVSNSLSHPGVVIIDGSLTNGVDALFPPQTSTVTRLYLRIAQASPPYTMGYVDIPATTSGYLRIVGATNSASVLVLDAVTETALASNATLFAGNDANYYRNFANQTNFQAWDDAAQTITETAFYGLEAGSGASFSTVTRTNGTTNLYLRLDVAGGGVTGACLTCSNEWTEANIYSGGAIIEYRGIQMKVSGNGNSNTQGTHASVSPMGTGNVARGNFSTVAGGRQNTASGVGSTVAGGYANTATGDQSTVVGGYGNTARGAFSVAQGGYGNQALGNGSVVAGYQNVADATYVDLQGYRMTAGAGADYSTLRGLFGKSTNAWTGGMLEGTDTTNLAEILRPYTYALFSKTTNQWRFGVGTNNPIAGLDVHGGLNFTGQFTSNGNPVTFSASATDAVHTIVTGGDNVTSSPQRITFMAGSGSSPTSTVSGSNTTVYLAAGGSGGGTLTNAISTSTYVTASVVGGQVVVGTTGTPIFVEIGTGTLVEASLSPYATGTETTNIAGRVAESYGFANSNTIGNATSIQGQAWSATAPTNAGAYPFWNGSGWVFSTAAPASSTGSVSSINLQVGNITLAGSGVTTTGTTINVGDSAPSPTAADTASNNIFSAINDFRISTQGYTRVDGGFDQAATYPRQHGIEVALTNASPNGSTVSGLKIAASASTSAGGALRDVGYVGGSQRVGTGPYLSFSTAGVQNNDTAIICGSNLTAQTHEHPSILLAAGPGPSGGSFINFGAVENAVNNGFQTVVSMARMNFGSSTGGPSAIVSFNDNQGDRDFIVYGDTNEALFVEGSSGRVMVGGPIDVTLPKPQELMHLTNGSFRVDGNFIIGTSGALPTTWPSTQTNKAIVTLVDEGSTNKSAWISDPDSGTWTKLTSHNADGDFVLTDIDENGMAREYNISQLFAALSPTGNLTTANIKQAFKQHSTTRRVGKTKAEKKAEHDALVAAWQDRKATWNAARQAERDALQAFRDLPPKDRRKIAAKGQKPPEPRGDFTEEKP